MRIETESKYYCIEPEKFIDYCEKLGLKRSKTVIENDEYFTDIKSNFIKNRTCLRLRNINNEKLEVTFKGKSLQLQGQYSKIENNIKADINEYDNFVSLFSSLGYYSYVCVNKERIVYKYNNKKIERNIMIDKLEGIGAFVEFEILSNSDTYDRKLLKKELNDFVNNFKEFNLKEATKPYRDIVATAMYKEKIENKKRQICIDIDSLVLNYEKEFYKKYKLELEQILNEKIKWIKFKNCDDKKIVELVNDYFDNKYLDNNDIIALFKLLDKLKYDIVFITKANKIFYTTMLNKLGVKINKTILNKTSNINSIIKNSIILNQDLKTIVEYLLIIINIGKK